MLEHSTGRAVARGKLTEEDQAALHSRVQFTSSLDELADCQLVVEAVPEHLDLKKELFGKLDAIVGPDAILATNTSSLSVTEISVATGNPKRVVGMHFFNPAPVLKFVEVIRTVVTEDEVVEDVKALAIRLGKQPVIVGDKAGFIANALLFGYLNHAVSMFESRYATREDIDAAMKLGCGYPMGPLALMDLIGLDTAYEILDTMYKQGRDRLHAPSPILKQMVSAGLKGRKSGRGLLHVRRAGQQPGRRRRPDPEGGRRVRAGAARGAHGRRRRLGHHGDRHRRGLRQGRLRRRLRRPAARPRSTPSPRRSPSRSRRPSSAASSSEEDRDAALGHLTGTTSLDDLADGRPRRRGGRRGPGRQAGAVREPRRDLQARRDPGHHDVVAARRRVRGGDLPPGGRHRHALLQPGPGHEARRGRAHRLDRARRRGHRAGRLRQGRQARRHLRRPLRLHRQRAALPLPQRRRQDARGQLRHRRRHRHRDEDRLWTADGPVRAARRRRATTSRWPSSASSTSSSASPASRRPRCSSTWSPPATSAARPGAASAPTPDAAGMPPTRHTCLVPPGAAGRSRDGNVRATPTSSVRVEVRGGAGRQGVDR